MCKDFPIVQGNDMKFVLLNPLVRLASEIFALLVILRLEKCLQFSEILQYLHSRNGNVDNCIGEKSEDNQNSGIFFDGRTHLRNRAA